MTGLEKIIDQILTEANREAGELVEQAKGQAEEILAEAKSESERITAGIRKKSASDVDNYKKRVQSANDLYRRNETLKSKQEVIAKVIAQAYDKVCGMDAESYFGILEKMIKKYALARDGEIHFSAKDLKAMPKGFEEKIQAAAKAAGGSLKLSTVGKNIENGFILVYGGIEENCTIKAMFDARRDEMQDTVHALLF